jgi:dTDP-4-amino-4,6-dideoxygalactose transaminase
MKVPLLDIRRQNLAVQTELFEAFDRVFHSGQFILGEEVERFENAAAAVAGTRFAIGMSSGTDAILVALMALHIGPGDEVICPAFTFFATAGCIARVGARPVFADSCLDSFNIDPDTIEPLITDRTKAIMPVHLFGKAAEMDRILAIARRHGLAVIEDAAQAFGAEYHGRPVGGFAEFGTVSFFPSKNLGALGDAGLLLTNDPELDAEARLLRNHGARAQYFHATVGGNFRLDSLQAAMLSVKLLHLEEYTAARQRHASRYRRLLHNISDGEALDLILPDTSSDHTHIVNQYTVRVRRGKEWQGTESPRDALRQFLREKEIGSAIYYPVPLHQQECFQKFGPYPALPHAELLAEEVLSLPVFPELTGEEQDVVAIEVGHFVAEQTRCKSA